MNTGWITLLVLVLVVVVGFLKKLNVGLIAIGAAAVIGYVSGQFTGKEIISGFSASLFMTLLGVTLFFGIIQENGCIELLMNRLVEKFGKFIWMVPILLFTMAYVFAAIGPGCIPAMAFAAAMAVPLAHESGYNPVMLLIIGNLGTYSGRFSPITPEGVLIHGLLEEQGVTVSNEALMLSTLFGTLVLLAVVFVVFKGYKVKAGVKNQIEMESRKFQSKQIVALWSIAVMILMVIFGKVDVGLASFLVSVFLIFVGIGNEKNAIASVPWNTLIMVCGVGVLMKMVIKTGGIDILSSAMSSVMSPWSAAGITGMIAAVMSWFSSAIGVVYPTLIPTVGAIAENVGGNIHIVELVSPIALFASVAGLSPASTGGAIIMGACGADKEFREKYSSETLFGQLLLCAIGSVIILAILAFVGFFGWFG